MELDQLMQRSGDVCELCAASEDLQAHAIDAYPGYDESIVLCATCKSQVDLPAAEQDQNHFRCLSNSLWSAVPAVQVLSVRLLKQLSDYDTQSFATTALESAYLEDDLNAWVEQGISADSSTPSHFDSNHSPLSHGDSVTLIKDLKVKGANFTAKQGTAVKNIRLVESNSEHIEGKVNGQTIVILTQYVKKS